MHGEPSRVCIYEANKLDELLSGTDALDTDNEETDPSFVLESSTMSDSDYITETFCEAIQTFSMRSLVLSGFSMKRKGILFTCYQSIIVS